MIDLSDKMNPAKWSAFLQAEQRANREGKSMFVYVGPPGTGAIPSERYNTWFVRSAEEGAPASAELYHTQAPGGAPLARAL